MIDKKLYDAAIAAQAKAYVPYSHFPVGAALESADGTIYHGCNIENASYGLCNCAERTAFFSALADGRAPRSFRRLLVVGRTQDPISPCGACRQVIHELGGPDLEVILCNNHGDSTLTSAAALLPGAFTPDHLV